jgi:hypothetical protein
MPGRPRNTNNSARESGSDHRSQSKCLTGWWAAVDSNHVPPRYQHGALPVELAAQGPAGRASSIPGIVSLLGRLI